MRKSSRKHRYLAQTVSVQAHVAVGKLFFQDARGEMDTTDEKSDLQKMLDKRWNRDCAVKDQEVMDNIDKIDKAHVEYTEFASNAVDQLEICATENHILGSGELTTVADSLYRMVMDNHRRHAEYEELGAMTMMKSLRQTSGLFVCLTLAAVLRKKFSVF